MMILFLGWRGAGTELCPGQQILTSKSDRRRGRWRVQSEQAGVQAYETDVQGRRVCDGRQGYDYFE